MSNTETKPGFYGLGIAPKLLEALDRNQYTVPTPIQLQAIPVALTGKDVVGIAQTGTGKTLAFGIPMIQRLAAVKGRGLVVLPTRELALQVEETMQKVGKHIGLRTACLIGGASMYHQKQALAKKPHIIVATPGRLIDHLEQRQVDLSNVTVLVLDEADRMLDMGFEPQIRRILQTVPKSRQTMLFSATMPHEIMDMANRYMHTPTRVEIATSGTTAEHVTQEVFFLTREEKPRLLEQLLGKYAGTVLVFSRTKHGATKLTRLVKAMGHNAAEIHSDRSLAQRRRALDGFKSGEFRILVATDIAARGIDVKGIELVLNYDLPDAPGDYVHRIGRTGRAGQKGHAISFATLDQKMDVRSIEHLIRTQIPVSAHKDLPQARFVPRAAYVPEPAYKQGARPKSSFYGGVNRTVHTGAPNRTVQAGGPQRFDSSRISDKKSGFGKKRGYQGHNRSDARREDRDNRPSPTPTLPTSGRNIRIHT